MKYLLLTLFILSLVTPIGYWHIAKDATNDIIAATGSALFRYAQWDSGINMWMDHPISGVGLGQFNNYLPYYVRVFPFYGGNYSPHSLYVGLLAETGLVGFLLFAGILFLFAKQTLRKAIDSGKKEISVPLQASLLCVFIVLLAAGITVDFHHMKLLWMVLGANAGALLIPERTAEQSHKQVEPCTYSTPVPESPSGVCIAT